MLSFENIKSDADTVLALGNFDGLHIGHMQVLKRALEISEQNGLEAAVLLFDEHPKKLLDGKRPPMLMTDEKKENELKRLGFKIIKVSFAQFKDLSAKEFVLTIYCELNVRAICCGFNYHYGKGGEGNAETLKSSCEKLGIMLCALGEVDYKGLPVSSTRIRSAVENGEIEDANTMLGRRFSFDFEVVHGNELGRVFGFPTINQPFPEEFVVPRSGVYCSETTIGSYTYAAVTNIGIKPTIGGETTKSGETNIIGFSGDLYGEKVEVRLIHFIRDEKKFGSYDELKKQISLDSDFAEKYHLSSKV